MSEQEARPGLPDQVGHVAREAVALTWRALWGDQRTFGPAFFTMGRTKARHVTAIVLSFLGAAGIFAAILSEQLSRAGAGGAAPAVSGLVLAALFTGGMACLPGGPLRAWRLTTVALLIGWATAPVPGAWPWPATASVLYLVVLFLVGLRHGARTTAGAWIVTVIGLVIPGLATVPVTAAAIAAATGLLAASGAALGERREAKAQVAAQREEIAADAVRRAVLEERAQIARELHDVVAHHMSMIVIQAQAATVRDPHISQASRESLAVIEQTARTSLAEARRLVGVLREEVARPGDEASQREAERAPQPSLAAIDSLVSDARRSGQQVSYQPPEAGQVPQAVQISAYRIVQEALSNARRHAPGAPVTVQIGTRGESLEVHVVNGPAPGTGSAPQAAGPEDEGSEA